jgi:hypothetical protein
MFLFVLAQIFSLQVFATPTGEVYFQPEQGSHSLQGAIYQTRTRFKTANGTSMTDTRTFETEYNYGFSSEFSAGILLGHSKTEREGSASYSGLDDIEFNVRGTKEMATGRLRYGTELAWSPEPTKDDSNGDTENQFSGANILTPYIGYEFMVQPQSYFGLSVSQELLLGKRTREDLNGDKDKTSGGTLTSLNFYYEHFIDKNSYSAVLSYIKMKDVKSDTGTSDGIDLWTLQFFSRYEVMPDLYVLPRFSYGETPNNSINSIKVDKVYVISFFVGARYLF